MTTELNDPKEWFCGHCDRTNVGSMYPLCPLRQKYMCLLLTKIRTLQNRPYLKMLRSALTKGLGGV